MTRISIRIVQDDTEVGRIDVDLPATGPEIVAVCQEWVNDWMAASRPTSAEEIDAFEEAFARQFSAPRQNLDERIRAEQALAARLIEDRRRAEAELKARESR